MKKSILIVALVLSILLIIGFQIFWFKYMIIHLTPEQKNIVQGVWVGYLLFTIFTCGITLKVLDLLYNHKKVYLPSEITTYTLDIVKCQYCGATSTLHPSKMLDQECSHCFSKHVEFIPKHKKS